MGDPAGIGPELIVRVLARGDVYSRCRPFVVGDLDEMESICSVVDAGLDFRHIEHISQARFAPGVVDVLCPKDLHLEHVVWGQLDPEMGQAAALCLRQAAEMAMADEVHGIVSAPLNKEAFHAAGYDYPDELAYLADLTGAQNTFIAGVINDVLWTVALTEHIPFRDIPDAITRERVLWYIVAMHRILSQAGLSAPRIAVTALNVHGGEGGLFGREEIDAIAPAIHDAQARGIDAWGPIPADTVFVRAFSGEVDGVVGMYHDQVNIARKLQPMQKRVTLFIGLPVVCGTTAHGTAFEIAGRGIADPGGLEAAFKHTIRLCAAKQGG
jgi:4-hydroxythreonine-4-phosphate dehydrogenase